MLYRYLNILFFIYFTKKKCISVCARRSLNGVRQSGCLSEASLIDFIQSYRLWGQKPFSAVAALLHVSANQGGNQKCNQNKWHQVAFRTWPRIEIHTSTSDFHQRSERWARRPAPSAAGRKIIKRELLLWVKGMKVWLTGEITQSVSSCWAQPTCS